MISEYFYFKTILVCGPYGGGGGEDWCEEGRGGVAGVEVRAGAWVDSVRLLRGGEWGAARGGGGGQPATLLLQPGDSVVAVAGTTDGRLVTQLQFSTARGATLGPVGAGAGRRWECAAPAGWELSHLSGRAGMFLDSLTVHWRPSQGPH